MVKSERIKIRVPVTTYDEVECVRVDMSVETAMILARVLAAIGGVGRGRELIESLSESLTDSGIQWNDSNPYYRKVSGSIDIL